MDRINLPPKRSLKIRLRLAALNVMEGVVLSLPRGPQRKRLLARIDRAFAQGFCEHDAAPNR